MPHTILLNTCYFGPVQYYSHAMRSEKIIVEQHEYYHRQSYRNRLLLLAANGPMPLMIPVKKHPANTLTKDVKISYDTNWQKLHWRSIVSAYNNSPFFEYYQDDIKPFYTRPWRYLIDLNQQALSTAFDLLELSIPVVYSDKYLEHDLEDITDKRESIHPKKPFSDTDVQFTPYSYRQVFSEKFGFIPNLSILDLLFNKGPEACMVLEQSLISG